MFKDMKAHWATFALALSAVGCAPEIDTVEYDTRYSRITGGDCPDGSCEVPRLDSCWLSGEEASVFVVELLGEPTRTSSTEQCPSPPNFEQDWTEAAGQRVAGIAGASVPDEVTLHTLGPFFRMPGTYFRTGSHRCSVTQRDTGLDIASTCPTESLC